MIGWRVSRHQSLGGSSTPGRWNLKGSRVLYTSNNPSLCSWEVFAHQVSKYTWPEDYMLLKINVEDRNIIRIPAKDLPTGWNSLAYRTTVRKFGSFLLAKNDILGFWVPSVVIAEDFNLVLNPLFPNYSSFVTLVDTFPFNYDDRFRRFFPSED